MKKQLTTGFSIALIALSLAVTGIATAIEPGDPFDQETIITGMVEQEGDTFILKATDGYQYKITDQDLSDLVGKKVQATGELIKEKEVSRFSVNEILVVLDEKVKQYRPFESGQH